MSDLASRLRDYVNSPAFSELPDYSLSEYWSYYHSGMIADVDGNRASVSAGSGLYEPKAARGLLQKLCSLAAAPAGYGRIVAEQLVRKTIRKFGMFDELATLPGDVAFDSVHQHRVVADVDISPYRLNFLEVARSPGAFATSGDVISDYRKNGLAGEPTGHIFLMYYYYNILNHALAFGADYSFLEIGAGNGNLTRLLLKRKQKKTSYIVDLPKTLIGSIEFLTRTHPELKVSLPHEAAAGARDADLVFLTPSQIDLIPPRSVSLIANIASFQEMKAKQVAQYFDLTERVAADGAHFLSVNRVEKIPGGPKISESGSSEDVMRAADYPWRPQWKTVVREICRLNRLMIRDNCEVRLCRVGGRPK